MYGYFCAPFAKKQSEGVRFLLIQHWKHSAISSKIHSNRLFFGDFSHCEAIILLIEVLIGKHSIYYFTSLHFIFHFIFIIFILKHDGF